MENEFAITFNLELSDIAITESIEAMAEMFPSISFNSLLAGLNLNKLVVSDSSDEYIKIQLSRLNKVIDFLNNSGLPIKAKLEDNTNAELFNIKVLIHIYFSNQSLYDEIVFDLKLKGAL